MDKCPYCKQPHVESYVCVPMQNLGYRKVKGEVLPPKSNTNSSVAARPTSKPASESKPDPNSKASVGSESTISRKPDPNPSGGDANPQRLKDREYARRYRKRNREEYNARQRDLMARKRAEDREGYNARMREYMRKRRKGE